jgi:hypothetical protein
MINDVQEEILLWQFQNIESRVSIQELKGFGPFGKDGQRHYIGNLWETVRQLRENGWVIETNKRQPSQYVFRGHFNDFDERRQNMFVAEGSVYPSMRRRYG